MVDIDQSVDDMRRVTEAVQRVQYMKTTRIVKTLAYVEEFARKDTGNKSATDTDTAILRRTVQIATMSVYRAAKIFNVATMRDFGRVDNTKSRTRRGVRYATLGGLMTKPMASSRVRRMTVL
jgi:hypothetical protein